MSHDSRPTLAACLGVALAKTEVFLSSLAVIPLVETASSPEAAASAAPPSGAR